MGKALVVTIFTIDVDKEGILVALVQKLGLELARANVDTVVSVETVDLPTAAPTVDRSAN